MSNCPPLDTRQILLQYRRAKKLESNWDSVNWMDHCLLYILRCLNGDILMPDPCINLSLTYAEIRDQQFSSKVDQSIKIYSAEAIDRVFLRWLLNVPAGHGVIRTLLLWILGRWNLFTPRRCKHCDTIFQHQAHIVDCTGLFDSFNVDPELPDIPFSSIIAPRMIVEYQIQQIRKETFTLIPSMLARLVDILRLNLNLVFGDTYTPNL